MCYIEIVRKSKEIYEHLARVYFDSSRNKKKNNPQSKLVFRNLLKLGIVVIVCLIAVVAVIIFWQKPEPKSQHALVLESNPNKIDYDFTEAKEEAAIFDLSDMNLLGFKTLEFRLRKSNYQDNLHMRIELISQYGEESQIYVKHIPTRWRKFKTDLSEFKDISDWSRMRQLAFVLEEWNAQEKKGAVYIDNVYFLK